MTDGDTYSRGEEGIRGGQKDRKEGLEDWTPQVPGWPLL